MAINAYIHDGIVWEVIKPMLDESGNEVPLSSRYTSAFCAQCVDITNVIPAPAENWTATENNGQWSFSAPA